MINDSVFGKKALNYWGTSYYNQINRFMVGIKNDVSLERGKPHLSKNV